VDGHYCQDYHERYQYGDKAECDYLIDTHFYSPYSLLDDLIQDFPGSLNAD
jgi:hypothetical protein